MDLSAIPGLAAADLGPSALSLSPPAVSSFSLVSPPAPMNLGTALSFASPASPPLLAITSTAVTGTSSLTSLSSFHKALEGPSPTLPVRPDRRKRESLLWMQSLQHQKDVPSLADVSLNCLLDDEVAEENEDKENAVESVENIIPAPSSPVTAKVDTTKATVSSPSSGLKRPSPVKKTHNTLLAVASAVKRPSSPNRSGLLQAKDSTNDISTLSTALNTTFLGVNSSAVSTVTSNRPSSPGLSRGVGGSAAASSSSSTATTKSVEGLIASERNAIATNRPKSIVSSGGSSGSLLGSTLSSARTPIKGGGAVTGMRTAASKIDGEGNEAKRALSMSVDETPTTANTSSNVSAMLKRATASPSRPASPGIAGRTSVLRASSPSLMAKRSASPLASAGSASTPRAPTPTSRQGVAANGATTAEKKTVVSSTATSTPRPSSPLLRASTSSALRPSSPSLMKKAAPVTPTATAPSMAASPKEVPTKASSTTTTTAAAAAVVSGLRKTIQQSPLRASTTSATTVRPSSPSLVSRTARPSSPGLNRSNVSSAANNSSTSSIRPASPASRISRPSSPGMMRSSSSSLAQRPSSPSLVGRTAVATKQQ